MASKQRPTLPKVNLGNGEDLAKKLHLHGWDYIIAGDGSATTHNNTAGFASILYCRHDGSVKKFFGGFSHGTNNVAEMAAFIAPLLYIDEVLLVKGQLPAVYIISDSTYVVNLGNGDHKRKTNRAVWSLVDHLKTKMNLIFVHVNRMLLPANIFSDQLSSTIRLYLKEITTRLDKLSTLQQSCPNEITQNMQK